MKSNKLTFDYVCSQGFNELELKENGNIVPCCPVWTDFYSFGNVFENNIDEIINSENAKKFRKSILDKTYEYCNTERCVGGSPISKEELELICRNDGTALKTAPNFSFGHDRCCNILCIFCRDNNLMNSDSEINKLNSLIDTHFLPLLKDTKEVKMLSSGEVFASKHGRKLIKSIAQSYPDIKFHIVSNGILFDEDNCLELGILDKLASVTISAHATTKATYNKLIHRGDFERLWRNIDWLISLKNASRIGSLGLAFTITHINFKEMKNFAQKAINSGIESKFWEYRKEEGEFVNQYDEAAVWEPNNKYHKEFIKIIKDPIFDSPNCYLSQNIQNIRMSDNIRVYKNTLGSFFLKLQKGK